MSHPQALKDRFIALRAAGLSYDKIAAEIDVSKPTLLKWSEECEKQIAAEEYVNAEALMTKHRLYRQARLEDAVKEFARVHAAIKARDLKKVNISTLLAMEEQRKEEIMALIADLQKHAGLNRDGEKNHITKAMIDEIALEVLGVPLPGPVSDTGVENQEPLNLN